MRRPLKIAVAVGCLAALVALALVLLRGPWSFHPFARERSVTVTWARSGPFEERCTTCHEGVTHRSAVVAERHPVARFGCTGCHGGDATAATKRAHEGLRTPEIEAGCGTCHVRADVEAAPLLAEGRALFRALRCAACHTTGRADALRGAGPPVAELASRTTPEHALRFLRAPRAALAGAAMPSFWPPPLDAATRAPLPPGSPGHAAWLARMKTETASVVAYLFAESDKSGLGEEIARRANVAGADAEEGRRLYVAIGCAACHEGSAAPRAPSLADAGERLREDWLAWFLEEPSRAHDGTAMPSMRLDRRAAASLARHLVTRREPRAREPIDAAEVDPARRSDRVLCSVGDPQKEMSRAACGEQLFAFYGCGNCHAPRARAPLARAVDVSLEGYAERAPKDGTWRAYTEAVLASPRVFGAASRRMPAYVLTPEESRALVVYLASLSPRAPGPAFDPYASDERAALLRGRELMNDLACAACHARGAKLPASSRVPPLAGEGERARASWLLTFLRDPGESGVRPWLHPEWVWGALVPPERLAPRMPTFALDAAELDALVRALGAREGDAAPSPSSSDRTSGRHALRACARCHYTGELPADRARTSLEALAPDLAAVPRRRQAAWVRAMLSAGAAPDASAPGPHAPVPEAEAAAITALLFAAGSAPGPGSPRP